MSCKISVWVIITTYFTNGENCCQGTGCIIIKYDLSLQDFCHGQVMWPPLSALQVKTAEPGKSCKQVCQENQLICEPSFFQHLNKDKALLR